MELTEGFEYLLWLAVLAKCAVITSVGANPFVRYEVMWLTCRCRGIVPKLVVMDVLINHCSSMHRQLFSLLKQLFISFIIAIIPLTKVHVIRGHIFEWIKPFPRTTMSSRNLGFNLIFLVLQLALQVFLSSIAKFRMPTIRHNSGLLYYGLWGQRLLFMILGKHY